MRPIPPKLRQELEKLPRMKMCAIAPVQHLYERCGGRIEWHHVWTYAGRQINELWAIVGGCHKHHEMVKEQKAVKMSFEVASLLLADENSLKAYPKKDWAQIKRSLGIKHGNN